MKMHYTSSIHPSTTTTHKTHTTWTKASPTRCNGSQISKRERSSSRNCWCILRMEGTMRKISSTVCASISDAFSCDFSGFKYFYKMTWEKKEKKPTMNKHSIYRVFPQSNNAFIENLKISLPWLPFPVIQRMISLCWIARRQRAFAYPVNKIEWKKRRKKNKVEPLITRFVLMAYCDFCILILFFELNFNKIALQL